MLRSLLTICFLVLYLGISGTDAGAQDSDVQNVQVFLTEQGYEPGIADGFMGPQTRQAIIIFQNDNDLPETGEVDARTLAKIAQIQAPEPVVAVDIVPRIQESPDEGGVSAWAWIVIILVGWLILSGRKEEVVAKKPATQKRLVKRARYSNPNVTQKPYASSRTSEAGTGAPDNPHHGSLMAITAQTNATARNRQTSIWVPKDSATSEIGGMIYVGKPPAIDKYGDVARGYIDPSLDVAPKGTDKSGNGLPYWPSYARISPVARATYLDWLATGRKDTSYDAGYMFLYFYGLERRFFVDDATADQKQNILVEVKRLHELYSDNYSARNYLSRFIDVASVTLRSNDALEPIFTNPGYEFPLSLAVALGTQVAKGETISAGWALSWFLCHPEKRTRTPAQRCKKEFQALFQLNFDAKYPDGMSVKAPQRILRESYSAASGEFDIDVNLSVDGARLPDISKLKRPLSNLQAIADETMEDLDKYSRFLGRNPGGRGTAEGQAMLPYELWELFPSEELDALKTWAGGVISRGGLVPAIDLIEKLEGTKPEKVGKRAFIDAADALARMGCGLAPDPRYSLRRATLADPVIIFSLPDPTDSLQDVSEAYKTQLMTLALSTFIAQADDEIAPTEQEALVRTATQAPGLSKVEHARLVAELLWMLAVPAKLTELRKKLQDASPSESLVFRQTVIAMAHADGVIRLEEVSGIEKIYKALGLEPSAVYSDLHSLSATDAPLTVRAAKAEPPGEKIPASPDAPPHLPMLDTDRIAVIQTDTAKVANVLGSIFGDADDDIVEEEPVEPQSGLQGLDASHGAFTMELIQRGFWETDQFEQLAKRHDLMVDGSLETINEWSFARFDDALIEAYEGYEINQDIAPKLKPN